ncbi:hydrogen gas-evolving membrane-bound hydrogenase subunit E [Sulfuriroseicoccus oceanibius]|uniref:DUF4040 domain-containing protein n=1 Tax=Sulfuriroseicoccus oceanibius TaxID=2707525 RepID=A0A6B3L987_9BACT|nr:hydrogen gas-evolving membrane-bound hydrogenase subunit E [Sulfuriroseicoccus oceanibius]QQL45574.1 DUF4040 domain-containing protein [Sulfuriroseicoccus oceanibius]
MIDVFYWLAAPVLLALIIGFAPNLVKRAPLVFGGGIAAVFLTAAVSLLITVSQSGEQSLSLPWLPQLGMDIELRVTSFSAWFAALIFTLGASIHLYAAGYFKKHERLPFLLICLLLFTASMVGVVWSDNFYLLFLFWEATSLLSFLLVGFHHEKEDSRKKAAQGLLVTLFGGAAMLAGFVLVQIETGASTISALVDLPLVDSPTITAALVLVVLGALTKSAQFPFHFWLPNAMAGPTPVSAFLHSATMVKAGVYLLAVLAPFFVAHSWWSPLLIFCGLATVLGSVYRALREDDMKSILASTTLAALGFLTVLAGVGTPAALKAFVIFLTAHALYKAPLFLSAGNLEKQFGTRKLSGLHGAARRAPLTGTVIVISVLSLIGFPPLPGFLAKEYQLKALWSDSPGVAIAAAIAAAGMIFIGLRLLAPLLARDHVATRRQMAPAPLAIATALPAVWVLLLMAFHGWANHAFFGPAATALSGESSYGYSLWHGWTPALALGMGALATGAIATLLWGRKTDPNGTAPGSQIEALYYVVVEAIARGGKTCGKLLEKGALSSHLALMIFAIGALSLASIDVASWPDFDNFQTEHTVLFIFLAPALAAAAIIAAYTDRPLLILVSLGFVGLLIAFLFLWLSAPDLALTQLLAETLIIFLITGVLLKAKPVRRQGVPNFIRFAAGAGATLLVTLLILKAMAVEWDHPVSDYYLKHSKSDAFGANVVNVILVDFRALDTLGEIVVLAIAAMGVGVSLGAARRRAPLPDNVDSPWTSTACPVLITILVPTALWIFWRGHNAPGGGFIAALMLAASIGLALLVSRPGFTPDKMRRLSFRLLVSGLAVALLSALLPTTVGKPFFTGLWLHWGDLHLGTPLLFDLGVMLTVLGFALSYLRHFHINSPAPCKS